MSAEHDHTPAHGILTIDGGLSTALNARGHDLNTALWTGELLRTNPEAIEQAHRDFVDAGADVLITGSYQLSFSGCAALGWTDSETFDALRASTIAARLAAAEGTLVAASIGPYGASLADGSEYRGNYGVSTAQLRQFHAERLAALIDTAPDLLAIETIPDTVEAAVILELLTELDAGIPFWLSYSCTDGNVTCAGQPFAEAAALVASHPDAIAVGANCTRPELITGLLQSADVDIPFVVYPNTGQDWDPTTKSWSNEATVAGPALIAEWVEAGAAMIGGCCGYTPEHIAQLAVPGRQK